MARFAFNRRLAGVSFAVVAGVGLLTGCGSDAADSSAADSAPIVIQPSAPGGVADTEDSAFDPRADLDIDDQNGNGQSVIIDAVRVTRDNAHIVILDVQGTVLGSVPVLPGVQIVQVELSTPITRSGEYFGQLVLQQGDEVIDMTAVEPLIDDEGEIVDEDFEYYLD